MSSLNELNEFLKKRFKGAKMISLVDFISKPGFYLVFDSLERESLNITKANYFLVLADTQMELNLYSKFKRLDELRSEILTLCGEFKCEVFGGSKATQNKNGVYCLSTKISLNLRWKE